MGGADRVFAGKHSRGCCYTLTYHHETLQEDKRGEQTAIAASLGTEQDCLLTDCLEENNADDTVDRKMKLSVKYYDALSYQSILNYLHNCIEASSSFDGLVADKYILQRVLRV